MSYGKTLEKAWNDLAGSSGKTHFSIAMLADTYDIDLDNHTVISSSCNIPAKDHVAIILLHYLIKKSRHDAMPPLSGEWIDFNQLEGGDAYYPAFKKRTIGHLIKKYGSNPEALLDLSSRMPIKKAGRGDTGIIIQVLDGVDIMITMEKADEEFGPDANILFDKTVKEIFCTEDIVVLTEFVIHSL